MSAALNKIKARQAFLETCSDTTRTIHLPIIDTNAAHGHLNPAGLGRAGKFSQGSLGQSTVAFDTVGDYHTADASGNAYDGGAEYGIVRTPEAARVSEKFAQLHGGARAIILPSGLNAISTVLQTFGRGDTTIFIPDNRYFPTERCLKDLQALNTELKSHKYSADAGAAEFAQLKDKIAPGDLLYIEAPGSQTFEIPEIDELIAFAKAHGMRTIMDNTWASHVRFRPIEHGADIVIQATTKYEGGYADTPSGMVIAASEGDIRKLAAFSRAHGTGTVSPQTCNRLFNRVASTQDRLDWHYQTALQAMAWFSAQPFTAEILSPAWPQSPYYDRFQKYFQKGNGLFTVKFTPETAQADINNFVDKLNLFRVGESWGGHVSLALPAEPSRELSSIPEGHMVRFSMGLEDWKDLKSDLTQAASWELAR